MVLSTRPGTAFPNLSRTTQVMAEKRHCVYREVTKAKDYVRIH
jgi:hypothetical protein